MDVIDQIEALRDGKLDRRSFIKAAAAAGASALALPALRMRGLYLALVTLMAAGGYVIHTFPTGQGNVVGNPIVPVIKISGNPRTLRTMSEHIDVDVTGVLTREKTIDQAGDSLIEMIIRTANGRLTCAEALGHRAPLPLVGHHRVEAGAVELRDRSGAVGTPTRKARQRATGSRGSSRQQARGSSASSYEPPGA